MNKIQQDALQPLLNTEGALAGLHKFFMEKAMELIPNINDEDDVVVGQKYRAHLSAIDKINHAFAELQSLREERKPVLDESKHL